MKSFRAAAGRGAAIVISVLALGFALGGGARASASREAAPAVTQHTLKLIHGWQSANPGNGTGSPRYAVSNGIVYLSGSLTQPSGTNDGFATLPLGARPAHLLYLPIYVSQGVGGSLQVFPNGAMAVFSNVGGAAQHFASLAGVSFPLNS